MLMKTAGYAVVRNAVTHAFCGRVESWFGNQPAEAQMPRIDNAVQHIGLLEALKIEKSLIDSAAELLGENLVLILNRHNHLTTVCSTELKSHRIHADSCRLLPSYLTLIIPILGFDDWSAWPQIVPASHLWSIPARDNGGGKWLDESDFPELKEQMVAVPMKPGDALWVDPGVFHRAGRGTVQRARMTLTLAVAANDDLQRRPTPNLAQLRGRQHYNGHQYSGPLSGQ
ncbi:phytanoyl-CoA dioxygenase family protein [Jatrophihabitans sp.]|uniref:phytanoyl-CoA dioxygenase family protein n=1 Tax=Jatrophihabitans sp. TaxID=1932789 RepID=UPI0038CD4F41